MSLPGHPVMTEDEFERQFDALVAEALRHGVDIEGFWSCGSPPEAIYEAEISRVVPKSN